VAEAECHRNHAAKSRTTTKDAKLHIHSTPLKTWMDSVQTLTIHKQRASMNSNFLNLLGTEAKDKREA